MNTTAKLKAIKEDYKELKGILTEAGPASCNAAKLLLLFVKAHYRLHNLTTSIIMASKKAKLKYG